MANNRFNDVASSNNQDERSINILDISKYLFFYWKWYLLSIAIMVSYFYYVYSKTPYVYSQEMSVMIKSPNNAQSTMKLRLNTLSSDVNIATEILQFQSKELMRQVVDLTKADISYQFHEGLRENELYSGSPVQAAFVDIKSEDYVTFDVKILNGSQVMLSMINKNGQKSDLTVPLGKTINTDFGEITINRTKTFSSSWYGKTIKVTKIPRENMVNQFLSSLNIVQTNTAASVIQLKLQDSSPLRASVILNTLVDVYNKEAIIVKNQVGKNTDKFINDRLAIIQGVLDSVENNLEQVQTGNGGLDIDNASEMFTSDSRDYISQGNDLETKIRLVSFMKKYLSNAKSISELIPNNTGLVDGNIESQINDYNTLLLKRNRLVDGGGADNPMVQDINQALHSIKQGIITAVNNTITGLTIRKNDALNELRRLRRMLSRCLVSNWNY